MRKLFSCILIFALVLGLGVSAQGNQRGITTAATGYQSAADVEYVTYSGTIQVTASTAVTVKDVVVNWGARGETATFLTTYAEDYYTGNFSWDTLSQLSGGSGTSNAYSSDLYEALQDRMVERHTHKTSYGETRAYFAFTDCVGNDYSQLSSFYSGKMVNGAWNGSTYNREHTWPNSKGLGGSDEDDIMMLRPTVSSENSSRGNKAYGESSGYYDPGADVRGDCARIVLYVYVRWGNTQKMWGTQGVMENLDVLLRWMEEDPVDTWEMGRNDAVESITGVRNVFVDYPEYAWLLFGREMPEDMMTPSGEAAGKEEIAPCVHETTQRRNEREATCGAEGFTGDTYCVLCGELVSAGTVIPATGEHTLDETGHCTGCAYFEEPEVCTHENLIYDGATEPTCGTEGFTGTAYCAHCGQLIQEGASIPATGAHENVEHRNQADATCGAEGHTGDVYCADCGECIAGGSVIPATGAHTYGRWTVEQAATETENGVKSRSCTVCQDKITEQIPSWSTCQHHMLTGPGNEDGVQLTCQICGYSRWEENSGSRPGNGVWIVIGVTAVAVIGGAGAIILLKRKKK